jgi:2-iminobutanoate/2-iminopropanoate deaminase
MKKAIKTDQAPGAVGPYSQGIESNGLVFVSGQIPLIPGTTGFPDGGIVEQTHQVMKNIGGVLAAAGLTYDDVVKCTCFLANMDDFKAMNEVYATYFKGVPPARAAFQVAKLPFGALIEIEAIATK